MKLRFLYSKGVPPGYGAAADAVIFEEVSENRSPPTLFIYSRREPTVSLGRFRDVEEDTYIDIIEKHGISVERRISGGSSVFTDSSQVIYSLIVKDTFENRNQSYRDICSSVVSALETLGIESEFKEPNDILVNGKKISGSAQYRAKGSLIQHGTLIVGPNPLMDEVLKPVKDRSYGGTVSLSELLGYGIPEEKVVTVLRNAFETSTGMQSCDGVLTDRESECIETRQKDFRVSVSDLSDP